ncbi:MAG: hypothetical protein HY556_05925 [Euryarchaeota archaeon]|nr:hypothetical protein [Euryarchaeota archaeon]
MGEAFGDGDDAIPFVPSPMAQEVTGDLQECGKDRVLLNAEHGSFRGEVLRQLGSVPWAIRMYAATDGCGCDTWA